MKKSLALLVVACFVVFGVVGCGGGTTSGSAKVTVTTGTSSSAK